MIFLLKLQRHHWILLLLVLAVILRLLTLGMYPLMDTTEARYGEIARKMVELNDWITPWFDYGVPFWGKPPLSFWMTAASFKLFGINEFTARAPHWALGIITVWLVWKTAIKRSQSEALYAVTLLFGSGLFFMASGMVMTDMALTLSAVISLRGFWLGMYGEPEQKIWQRWLLFVGFGIGLLAKGPIALILFGAPILVWVVLSKNIAKVWRELPWIRGIFLTLAIAMPWYVVAELRTPGFLNYFIIGEHWHRFVTPGWNGDLYGSAHKYRHGTIWLFALADLLPWSLLVPIASFIWRTDINVVKLEKFDSWSFYLICWGLIPCIFFTLAGNILWAYVLPGMPALALWAASYLAKFPRQNVEKLLICGLALSCIAYSVFLISLNLSGRSDNKSAKPLITAYLAQRKGSETLVIVGGGRLFSAAFYSKGKAERIADFNQLSQRLKKGNAMVAIDEDDVDNIPVSLAKKLALTGKYGKFYLLKVNASSDTTPK